MTQPDSNPRTYGVAIIGAGFGGLGLAIRLRQAGRDDFVVLEQAQDVGGTWRDNTYPGCACDIPANLYSYSFAQAGTWSRRYPSQPELLAYLRDCSARFGVGPHLRLGTALRAATYDADQAVWRLRTDGGELTARALVLAVGALHRPAIPDIPGLDTFAGPRFHTARWDHGVALDGKAVGVIGTGASAVQLVPAIAQKTRTLLLFQRSAAWVLPKHDPEASGLRRRIQRNGGPARWLARAWTFWTHEARAIGFVTFPSLMASAERRARSFAKRHLIDPALRERLTPDYTIGCKRVLLSNDFLPALNRDNVRVVTDPITRVTPDGIETRDGTHHRLDVLVHATGFQAANPLGEVRITGRDGLLLDQVWHQGMHAWLGLAVAGFPNLYLLGGPNTGLGHNSVVFMLEAQINHVLRRLRAGPSEVTTQAETGFRAWLDARMRRTVWLSGCRSWYLDEAGRNTTLWPGYCVGYWWRTRFARASAYQAPPTPPSSAGPSSGHTKR